MPRGSVSKAELEDWEDTTGIYWVEVRDAAKHPRVPRILPCSGLNCVPPKSYVKVTLNTSECDFIWKWDCHICIII